MSLRQVGKVKAAHGLSGELFIIFFSKDYSWIGEIETIIILNKAYSVLKIAEHKDGLKVKVKGVSDRNHSESLIGLPIYLPEDFFESEDGDSLYLAEIEGFLVIDTIRGELGLIKGFSSNKAQDLLLVSYNEKLIEIPFVQAFVEDINHDKKVILMNLPEGLIEINDE
ncbi:MAG: ribosome maturation factor RimM [Pseudobdellovibrio sp.]